MLGYFCVVDDDIGDVKFGEQFVSCNLLLLVWVGWMGEEGFYPWVDRF